MKTFCVLCFLLPIFGISQKLYFEETFDKMKLGNRFNKNWTVQNKKGKNTWHVSSHKNAKTKLYAKISGYRGSKQEDDWLILRQDLSACYKASLSFESATGYYKHNGLSILISDSSDFSNAKKLKEITIASARNVTRGNFSSFIPSGKIDLSAHCGGEVYIGFHYIGNNTSQSTTFEIDNIKIWINN